MLSELDKQQMLCWDHRIFHLHSRKNIYFCCVITFILLDVAEQNESIYQKETFFSWNDSLCTEASLKDHKVLMRLNIKSFCDFFSTLQSLKFFPIPRLFWPSRARYTISTIVSDLNPILIYGFFFVELITALQLK